MKKNLMMMAVFFLAAMTANAQLMRAEELEKYAKEKYGDKWTEAAQNIKSQLTLDKNNALTYTQVIQAPGKPAAQLYVILNYWYTATFNDANSVKLYQDSDVSLHKPKYLLHHLM